MENTYHHLSLKTIFERLSKSDDKQLYDYFFNTYYPKLIGFSLLYVKKHYLAEEVVSDVFLTILKRNKKIAEMDSIEGYLFILVKNQSIKRVKKSKVVYSDDLESKEDLFTTVSPEEEYLGDEFYHMLKTTIESLPPKRKMIFKLIKEDKVKYKDVAKLLKLSVKTVEVHMGLALKTIRTAIVDYRTGHVTSTPIVKISR